VHISSRSVSYPTPHFGGIYRFIGIQSLCSFQKHIRCFRIEGVRNTAIINGANRGTLGFIKVTNTLGAAVMRDYVNIVADTLPIADVIAFALRVAPGFKDRFIRAFRQASPARDAFVRNQ
jgi:hypothetical protein